MKNYQKRQEFDEPWENIYHLQNHLSTFLGNQWLSVCCKKSNALNFNLLLKYPNSF